MRILDRLKTDKIAVMACIVLAGALVLKLVQAVILHIMTDFYPVTTETVFTTLIGMAPSIMLMGYLLFFYKTDKPQLLLPCTFLFQLAITGVVFWVDYNTISNLGAKEIINYVCWIVYYIFLFFVTYKGFENAMLIRVVIVGMSLYSIVASVVTWLSLIETFPEETVIIVSETVAILGYMCHYLAMALIVPKVAEESVVS